MALSIGFFFAALLCTALGSPLGETTVCESASGVLPGLGLGVSPLGLNLPPNLLLQLLSANLLPGVLPLNTGLLPTSQATVCESTANLPMNLPVPMSIPYLPGGLVNNLSGSSTVCESTPNAISPFVGLPGLGLPYARQLAALNLGMGLPLNGLGLSMGGLGLPLGGLGGLGISPLGLPVL